MVNRNFLLPWTSEEGFRHNGYRLLDRWKDLLQSEIGRIRGISGIGQPAPSGGSSGGGSSGLPSQVALVVEQAAHGFVVGDALKYDGVSWAKAQANALASLAHGVVTVAGTNDFVVGFLGAFETFGHGKSTGQHYLDASTAGATTTTAPSTTGQFVQPLFVSDGADFLLIRIGTGVEVP